MCGIAGMFRPGGEAVDASCLSAMLDAIRHRGPDDEGTWVEGNVALGHTRLSILDLTDRAHQPMRTADGRGVLVYNGEVYNFRDLRAELEAQGATFRSRGDTEVVLEALHRWGPRKALPRFDGMFALVYFDRRDGALWLARDRFGIKSLSFTERRGTWIVASELKALLRHPLVEPEVDRASLDYYLIHGRADLRHWAMKGLEAVAPGTAIRIAHDGVETTEYFNVLDALDPSRIPSGEGAGMEAEIARTRALLQDSVRMHLVSDAPVAVMCSGGVDSSLVTAIAKDERPDIEAYVADVADVGGKEGEGDQAERMAAWIGVPIHRVKVDRETHLRLWPMSAWHNDVPLTHASSTARLAVALRCREDGIKVLLTGEGADELFGGYPWHGRTLRSWRKARRRARLPWPFRGPWKKRWQAWQQVAHSGVPCAEDARLRRRLGTAISPGLDARRAALMEHLRPLEPVEVRATLAHQLDDLYYHLGWILHEHDRHAMTASIEARVPFLENALADYTFHLPMALKNRGRTTKRVLKAVAEERLPHDAVHVRKKGFPVPGSHWRGTEALLRQNGVAPDLMGWSRSETDHVLGLAAQDDGLTYHLVSLELWGRLYIRGETQDALAERLLACPTSA